MTGKHTLPQLFSERLRGDFSEQATTVISALEGDPERGINLNRHKPNRGFEQLDPISWNPYGRRVAVDFSPVLDPSWHAGTYYVMEPASQAVGKTVQGILNGGAALERVLDLCAAPGGKTTCLLNVLNDASVLVSNEVHRTRAQVLYENAVKWGNERHVVCSADPDKLAQTGSRFDLVLVDAPCSGEGMFRKDHAARGEWSPAQVRSCAVRQEGILNAAEQLLRSGGYLLYSTCTFAHEENDRQMEQLIATGRWALADHFLENTGAIRTRFGVQFMPGITRSEGLYCSVLQYQGEAHHLGAKTKRFFETEKGVEAAYPAAMQAVVAVGDGRRCWHMHPAVQAETERLRSHGIQVLKAGIALGEWKAKTLIPDHEATMATGLLLANTLDLSENEALDYLRGHSGRTSVEKGYAMVAYQGVNLGWIKGLGDRWNNGYPKPWRLRK
jgi:16S rRNA C967 or C1407 C5-methylase (RsmB/RsmF family)/NOL1/NOP2/fmu family ribosome biogenesis protein